jgi:hypothetical protein
MNRTTKLKINSKLVIVLAIVALIIVAFFLSRQTGGGIDTLSEAMEGGELTLTSVGRNYESLMQFVQSNETQARQLLEGARVALEDAKAKLNSAGARTSDEYVRGMLDSYQKITQASNVMSQGVENLLHVNENLTSALDCYSQKNFDEAAQQAAYCLKVLEPLLKDFDASNTTLNEMNVFYIPSGQRDLLTVRVEQYRNETKIYNQYVLLLRAIVGGKDYLQMNAQLEDYMRQLQSALANNDYAAADELLQEISQILQTLRSSQYQEAAEGASQLDPSMLSGSASDVGKDLRNQLRNLEGINAYERYLESLQKYLEALKQSNEGNSSGAEQSINQGLGLLGQGQGTDPELQGLYEGLREAFNTLQLNIRGPQPPG